VKVPFPKILLGLCILTVVGCKSVGGALLESYTVKIEEKTANEKMVEKFPISKEQEGVTITLLNPGIEFRPGSDRAHLIMEVHTDVERKGRSREMLAKVLTSFRITYDPNTYQFFVQDVKIESVDWLGAEERRAPGAKVVLQAAVAKLDGQPIHTITEEGVKNKIAKMLLKDIQVKNGFLLVTLGFL
jgi:hypothetical protein